MGLAVNPAQSTFLLFKSEKLHKTGNELDQWYFEINLYLQINHILVAMAASEADEQQQQLILAKFRQVGSISHSFYIVWQHIKYTWSLQTL